VISAIPQDLKFGGEITTAEIGDNTTIRECVTVNRGTSDRQKTVIGPNCLIMAYVHIAHDCVIGNQCIIANAVQLAGHVNVGDFAIIGGSSAVHQFGQIGRHVMISGGSLVRKDVPPFTKSGREPLTYAGVNSIGLKRRGFTDELINEIQEAYRFLYNKGLNTHDALEQIEKSIRKSPERDEIIDFIRNSERGIMKG
jgi:UDP-N-acetylglucosamine acyltransferase